PAAFPPHQTPAPVTGGAPPVRLPYLEEMRTGPTAHGRPDQLRRDPAAPPLRIHRDIQNLSLVLGDAPRDHEAGDGAVQDGDLAVEMQVIFATPLRAFPGGGL